MSSVMQVNNVHRLHSPMSIPSVLMSMSIVCLQSKSSYSSARKKKQETRLTLRNPGTLRNISESTLMGNSKLFYFTQKEDIYKFK